MKTDITKTLKVSEPLKKDLLDFAISSGLNYFITNPYGPSRRMCNLSLHDLKISQDVKEFSNFCFNKIFGIDRIIETHFGNFLGVNGPGAFVHPHTDRTGPNNECHVRLNFIIQKPLAGGLPIINGNIFDVEENECWINLASRFQHSSTPVQGDQLRIVLSLGSFVDDKIVSRILK